MKVAIVYDRVNKWGGAERVLLTLHEMFPDAPLYTSVYDEKKAPWAKVFPKICTTFLQQIPFISSHHEWLGWLMPLAFESFDFRQYDLVISVTSEFAKGIITLPNTKHLCLCLTPTRYLWSGYDEYFKSWWFRAISAPGLWYLREWDKIAARRPDVLVAISTEIKARITKYYNCDSVIIFPPVRLGRRGLPNLEGEALRGYYLVVSRLVPYKRVDLVVKAFNQLGRKLVIVGTGSEEKRLRQMAKKNITFTGFVPGEKLADYYQGARAFVMPQEEDFGISAVEAQSLGVPVVAYKAGGAMDTVVDGLTGVFFDRQTVGSLKEAITKFEKIDFNKYAIIKNADRFSESLFRRQLLKLIKQK
ncbi:hypothetical protein A2188_02505 [Candidatus Woesebacteria bacterium RIFOXYA1_FULL_43_9]|uniref:Glycosyl transferase family 1 domain-containing protein n=1 Tax=Candidatus Woesebacteria bacterium RIFOXYA1_FULL_43_9 TaxID=1802534 RepID=A0A1F8CNY9_9BACT|nr:MAG: hypothetical protein A2188_02505 [Candidatus Woesebacteria bacterium RIFOXYA1_FULL_43_9]